MYHSFTTSPTFPLNSPTTLLVGAIPAACNAAWYAQSWGMLGLKRMVIGLLWGILLIPALGVTGVGDLFLTLVVVGHGDIDVLLVGDGESSMVTTLSLPHTFMNHAAHMVRRIPQPISQQQVNTHTTHDIIAFCCSKSNPRGWLQSTPWTAARELNSRCGSSTTDKAHPD